MKWTGKCVNGKAVGKGLMTISGANANIIYSYDGEYQAGLRNGSGTGSNGSGNSQYAGQWKDDIPNGNGTLTTSSGITYSGGFVNAQRNGFGILTAPRNAYVAENRSKLGEWAGDVFVEKGYFKDGGLVYPCTSPQNCKQEQAKREAQERREAADREASNRQACSRLYIGKPVSWPEGRTCVLTGCDNFTLHGQIVGVGNGVASAKVTESYKYGQVHEKACNEF